MFKGLGKLGNLPAFGGGVEDSRTAFDSTRNTSKFKQIASLSLHCQNGHAVRLDQHKIPSVSHSNPYSPCNVRTHGILWRILEDK